MIEELSARRTLCTRVHLSGFSNSQKAFAKHFQEPSSHSQKPLGVHHHSQHNRTSCTRLVRVASVGSTIDAAALSKHPLPVATACLFSKQCIRWWPRHECFFFFFEQQLSTFVRLCVHITTAMDGLVIGFNIYNISCITCCAIAHMSEKFDKIGQDRSR